MRLFFRPSVVMSWTIMCRTHIRVILFCVHLYVYKLYAHTTTTIIACPSILPSLSLVSLFFPLLLPVTITTNNNHSSCQIVCTCRAENIGSSPDFFLLVYVERKISIYR